MTVGSVRFRSLDGLWLRGTLTVPEEPGGPGVVLVHGGGVTREEGGFFGRLAEGLRAGGVASLRYDLRGHGESEGRQEDATLAAHLNDLRVAIGYLIAEAGVWDVGLAGAGFGGGLCAYYAAKRPGDLDRLVLLSPNLHLKRSIIDEGPHWDDDAVSDEGARLLAEHGAIARSPMVTHGRALLNEVFWMQPVDVLDEITAPTLLVHRTADTLIPVESSRAAASAIGGHCELVEIDSAHHGFAVHGDPTSLNPGSQRWQAFVISTVVAWLAPDGR